MNIKRLVTYVIDKVIEVTHREEIRKRLMLSIVEELRALNHTEKIVITGSLALYLQGVKIRRIPKDLDLACRNIEEIEIPNDAHEKEQEYYGDSSELRQLYYKGIKIDLFENTKDELLYSSYINGTKDVCTKRKILLHKLNHALWQNCKEAKKHKKDIIYIIKHN